MQLADMRQVLWLLVAKLASIDFISAVLVRDHRVRANVSDTEGCVPSDQADNVDFALWIVKHFDSDQMAALAAKGKLQQGKLTDIAFTHIPKNAGAAIMVSFWTIGVEIGAREADHSVCLNFQMPPERLAMVNPEEAQRAYGGGREVFCVVRDPYSKAISAACHLVQYTKGIQPTRSVVNEVLRNQLVKFRSDYNLDTCFWAPQVDYMKGQYGCTHALDFRYIERDFSNYTKLHGYNLTLPGPGDTHKCTVRCNFTKDDLDSDVLSLIQDTYSEDFEQLGPTFGFEA